MSKPIQPPGQSTWIDPTAFFRNFMHWGSTTTDDSTIDSPLNEQPLSTDDQNSASSAAASELERRAKLSLAAQVVDKTSQFVWWSASLPGQATSALLNKCKGCVSKKGKDLAFNMVVQQATKLIS